MKRHVVLIMCAFYFLPSLLFPQRSFSFTYAASPQMIILISELVGTKTDKAGYAYGGRRATTKKTIFKRFNVNC